MRTVQGLRIGWLASLIVLAGRAWAQEPREYYLDIPRQPVRQMVGAFFRQTGIQTLFVSSSEQEAEQAGTFVGPLKGRYTASAALTELLKVTELTYKWTDERTIAFMLRPPSRADAVAGVINIVLKKDIPHPVVDLHFGAAHGGADERRVSLSAGLANELLKGSLVLDYFERDTLLGAERDLWRDQDYRRFNSVDRRSLMSNPGNIASLTDENLPGLPSRFAAVPVGSTGVGLTSEDFLATAGRENRDSLWRFWSITPAARRLSAVASADIRPMGAVAGFGEFIYAHRTVTHGFHPPMLFDVVVPATNAFNPFGTPVKANFLLSSIDPGLGFVESELARGLAGVRGEWKRLEWEFSLLRTEERGAVRGTGVLNPTRVTEALGQSDPTRALNVFQDGPGGSPDLLASLLEPTSRALARYSSEGSQAAGYLRGPLIEVPAGDVLAVLGGEWRGEAISQRDWVPFSSPHRTVWAAFAEAHVPLVSPAMQVPGVDELSLTLAGRADHYGDFGDTFNPQYGLIWRPLHSLTVRTSYGTSFRPPSLYELSLPNVAHPLWIPDPRRDGEVTVATGFAGGNTDLGPVTATGWTAGIVFTPPAMKDLNASAGYWRITVNHRISTVPPQVLLAHEELFPDRVVRAEPTAEDVAAGWPGVIESIDTSRVNFGRLKTSGVDLNVSYTWHARLGRFTPRLAAAWVNRFRSEDLPGVPPVDRVGVASSLGTIPKWRAVASLNWNWRAVELFAAVAGA